MGSWLSTESLLGYSATLCLAGSAAVIAWRQRTSATMWVLTWVGNALWIAAGCLMAQPAVVVDVLAFVPIHAVGTLRYFRGGSA